MEVLCFLGESNIKPRLGHQVNYTACASTISFMPNFTHCFYTLKNEVTIHAHNYNLSLMMMEVSGGGDGCRGLYSVQKDYNYYDHSIFHYMAILRCKWL